MIRIVIFLLSLLLFSSCARQELEPLVREASGDACGKVKVPLPLASKVMDDRLRGSIHIWRVGLKCRVKEVTFDEGKQTKVEDLQVHLVMKGFVEGAFDPYDLTVPIVVLIKDDIADRVIGRRTAEVSLRIGVDETTAERSYNYSIPLKEDNNGEFRKRIYPTVLVGIQLLPSEWKKYKNLIEKFGERSLLPGA